MKSKTKAVSEADTYIATIAAAAQTHAGVKDTAGKIADSLWQVMKLGVRQPNDWEFHYSGSAEFRWYDGPQIHSSSSGKYVSLVVGQESVLIGGRLSQDKYGQNSGVRIEGLTPEDAATILKILVGIVDAKPAAKAKEG